MSAAGGTKFTHVTSASWIGKFRGFKYIRQINMLLFGLSPLPVTVANEGLGWDPRA